MRTFRNVMISHETSALSETAVVREQCCHHLQLLYCTPRDGCVCMRVFVKGVFFARFLQLLLLSLLQLMVLVLLFRLLVLLLRLLQRLALDAFKRFFFIINMNHTRTFWRPVVRRSLGMSVCWSRVPPLYWPTFVAHILQFCEEE